MKKYLDEGPEQICFGNVMWLKNDPFWILMSMGLHFYPEVCEGWNYVFL